jgi:hypothetical protein
VALLGVWTLSYELVNMESNILTPRKTLRKDSPRLHSSGSERGLGLIRQKGFEGR